MNDVRRLPVIEPPSSLRQDGSRAFVYTADVHGRFATARRVVFAVLIAVYVALPWIPIGGRPAVFLDVEHREFFLFGETFNAQDVWLVFFLVTGAVFGLVVLTAVAGRVWCGWACPQTVFLDGVFRPIERLVEGNREARLRRAKGPWTLDLVWRKALVHALYLLLAAALAHVLVSYFVSLPRLWAMMRAAPSEHLEAFVWTGCITVALYVSFGHFREQLCLGVCPYGRLQAALTDADSLVVGYDARRGEPRGKVGDEGKGACIDCNRCVVVCPTGIDIRRGQQLDCIGCTACIDACDEIMDKVHRRRGLVRYDSLRGLEGGKRQLWRPRLAIYAVLGALGLGASSLALAHHTDFEAHLLRIPGAPYTVENGVVRDAFELHLVNKRNAAVTLDVEALPLPGVTFVIPLHHVALAPLDAEEAPVFVTIPHARFREDLTIRLHVRSADEPNRAPVEVTAEFLGPQQGAD